jgi:glycosyltransferase involved in cell wall biosynthesis
MKIGFDISHSVGEPTGLGSYALGLLEGLSRVDPVDEFLVYSFFYRRFPRGWRDAKIPSAPNIHLNLPRSPDRWLLHQLGAGGKKAESLWGNVDIVHSNANVAPFLEKSRLVFTAFDTTIYLFPELHTKENYDLVNCNMHRAARQASFIITLSESSRRDIQRFLHVPDDRIAVVYGAADERFHAGISAEDITRVKKLHGISGDYILTVGTTEPRKNISRLIAAFHRLVHRGEKRKLVVAGSRGWLHSPVDLLVKREGLQGQVIFTGYVPGDDLPALYAGASLFVYPSLYEGFGLPVVEAMACGTPVITSNRSSLPEVAGDAALLVNPESESELMEALMRLLEDQQMREEYSWRSLQRSKQFSWETSAQETLKIYRKVMELPL